MGDEGTAGTLATEETITDLHVFFFFFFAVFLGEEVVRDVATLPLITERPGMRLSQGHLFVLEEANPQD